KSRRVTVPALQNGNGDDPLEAAPGDGAHLRDAKVQHRLRSAEIGSLQRGRIEERCFAREEDPPHRAVLQDLDGVALGILAERHLDGLPRIPVAARAAYPCDADAALLPARAHADR